ncbi:hypothetical protein OHA21_06580 [Actinoplanes sp. NBC_00393]|uniref:hypothetical protein n=1 Tax=Actinoplanes sp. NBC_00393 TaxID=2975953 RepID=UPI002E1A6A45
MTAEDLRPYRDLRLALDAAASLQATIRHADMKAQILLGLHGGMAVAVLQQAPMLGRLDNPALNALAVIGAIAWLAGVAVSGWHLLATLAPRLTGPPGTNRFAFPARPPETDDIAEQRDEAWSAVSTLADIALAKHGRVLRSLPGLCVASASAGLIVALAAVVIITT